MLQYLSIGIIIVLALVGSVLAGDPFGKAADGTAVESITLKNKNGMTVKVMTLGATITEIDVPDKNGKFANVVLGFDSAEEYESGKNQSFGATVGRVCNRTAKGKFTLEGKEYQLAINNGPNHLHGGVKRNLSKVVWQIAPVPRSIDSNGKICASTYTSPDGEEGYPGTVKFRGALHSHRQERTPHRLFRHHRQGDADQHDESQLFQPGRRRSPTCSTTN